MCPGPKPQLVHTRAPGGSQAQRPQRLAWGGRRGLAKCLSPQKCSFCGAEGPGLLGSGWELAPAPLCRGLNARSGRACGNQEHAGQHQSPRREGPRGLATSAATGNWWHSRLGQDLGHRRSPSWMLASTLRVDPQGRNRARLGRDSGGTPPTPRLGPASARGAAQKPAEARAGGES